MFILYNSLADPQNRLTHKDFVMALVDKLIQKSQTLAYHNTRSIHKKIMAPEPFSKRSRQLDKRKIRLPDSCFDGEKSNHVCTTGKKRSTCKYCKYLQLRFHTQNKPGEPPKISNICQKCAKCDVYLCLVHFDVYHMNLDDEVDASSLLTTSL